jgi:hypothetical protein
MCAGPIGVKSLAAELGCYNPDPETGLFHLLADADHDLVINVGLRNKLKDRPN